MRMLYRICDLCKKKVSEDQADNEWTQFKVHISKHKNDSEQYFPYCREPDDIIDLCPECATKVGRDGLIKHLYTDEDYL